MSVKIHPSWKEHLHTEFEKPYFKELTDFVRSQYQTTTVYPPPQCIFSAFDHCPFDAVRVVILGQDPYHGPKQAHGLCFSVTKEVKSPPSLKNIFKEIHTDIGCSIPEAGDLTKWADQGVLLLNATLTVQAGSPGSHQKKGWEEFTDEVIRVVSKEREHVVLLLWGAYARRKVELIDASKHHILEAPHPSPFSADRGFFGCKHFSQTNDYLVHHGYLPIDWCL